MTRLDTSVSVVIPVYNAEPNLRALVARLKPALEALGRPFEAILVDDGSADGSSTLMRALAAEHAWVRPIELMRNYGQHNALLCGIRTARHSIVVTMDDDLQHPPEEIQTLLSRLEQGADVVYGSPIAEPHGWARGAASRLIKFILQQAMGVEAARRASAFRAFRTELRDAFAEYHAPYVSVDVLLTWGTTRFAAIDVRHDPRAAGRSNYTVRKLFVHALNMITGYSTWPLKLASFLGFGCMLFGIGVLIYVIGRYIALGGSVPGFPFLASTIAIFSGSQLFALGIIGEYLARMHLRMMERPTYAVRRHVDPIQDLEVPR